jgi:4'-phosphopantetheinyl transferase
MVRSTDRRDDPPMDLPTAFEHALPSAGWPFAGGQGTLAVFIAADAWSRWNAEAFALLDVDERERVLRKRRPDDRALTTLAYACHRLLLSAVLECTPGEVPLGRDARGCPIVAGDRLLTSLSHADGLVAIAVSSAGPVGIDIEPATRAGDMVEIAGRVCHPRELAARAALPDREREGALLSLWVCKEALLKAAGIGMAVEMDRFEAPPDRVLALPGNARNGTATIRLFDGGERFLAAVAAAPGAIASTWLAPAG